MSHSLELRILGALEVQVDGERRNVRGAKQRGLLTYLMLHAGEVVPADRLVDALWGEEARASTLNTLQVHVSQLRKVLGRDVLATRPPGYALDVDPDAIDAVRFERLAAEGSTALARGDPGRAWTLLVEALGLWRGTPLADVAYEPFAQAEIARLEELRQTAFEERLEADLALGRHAEVLGEVEALVTEHPLRERLRSLLMLCLYRSGRQADALDAYKQGRRLLREELGLDPSPALQELERKILVHDPSLDAPPRRPAPATGEAPRAVRKTVTVLAAELRLAGPELDPEARQAMLAAALDVVAEVVQRHGGTVGQKDGEALSGVFGAPVAHEDDALRAVRAATELGPALAGRADELRETRGVSLTVHAGVDTGTALAGKTLAGEVVGGAGKLSRAADAGETLLADRTRRLVRDAVDLEPAGEAFRVAGAPRDVPLARRRLDARMVGRERELERLLAEFERARDERRATLLTVLGPAGIGKSRLVRELADRVEDEATVLHGRSPSYGDQTSLRPLADVVRQAAGDTSAEAVAELLGDHEEATAIAERLAAAAGRSETPASTEEIFWAARRLFEHLARERPLVLVFEDVHWAAGSFLALVESVVELSRASAIVVVCLARPELLEARPAWGPDREDATATMLEPLTPEDSEALVADLGGETLAPTTRVRVVETADGNPLFLEQLLAALAEEGVSEGALDLPPTIEALVAARLDRLDGDERSILERAAVVGKEFRPQAVAALADEPDGVPVGRLLDRLAGRGLVLAAADPEQEGRYRFHHVLVREIAYQAIPKTVRAGLHERFADWLEEAAGNRLPEQEEVIGFHLEQAHRFRVEVEGSSDRSAALGERAAAHLAAAGRRAYARDDGPAAAGLLSRAGALLPETAPERLDLLVDLGEALRETGDFERARDTLSEATATAEGSGELATGARARVVGLRMRMQTESEFATEDVLREVGLAIDVLADAGDERGLARAWTVRAWIPWLACRAGEAEEALARAIELACKAGDDRTESYATNLLLGVALFGPAPVPEAVRSCEEVIERAPGGRRVAASAFRALAGLRAMEGRFDEARTLLEQDRTIIEDLGLRVAAAVAAEIGGLVELLAGDPRAAEERLREGMETLERLGERSGLSTLAPMLARALALQGRDEEALRQTEVGEQLAPGDDLSAQVQWRGARAVLLSARGDAEEAEELARTAVGLAEGTDFLNLHGDSLADLAEVLAAAGRSDEATEAAAGALELYELKGNVVSADRLRDAVASEA